MARVAIGILLAVALITAGCATPTSSPVAPRAADGSVAAPSTVSQGGAGAAGQTAAAAQSARFTGPPSRLVLGSTGAGAATHYWAVYVGKTQGFFAQEGIDLELVQVPAAYTLSQAVLSGDINMVTFTVLSMAAAVAAGAPLKFVASAQDVPVLQLIGGPGVQRWLDLRGKVVGSGNSAGDYFDISVRMMMSANGLHDGDYTVRTMPGAARVPSLLSGQIAASILNERDARVAMDAGSTSLGYMHQYVSEVTYSGFMVGDAWARANEATLVRHLRAMLRGTEWLFDPANRAEAVRIFQAEAPELDRAQVEEMYSQMIDQRMLSRTLRPPMPGVENILNLAHQLGALTEIPPYDTWIDLSYLDKASR